MNRRIALLTTMLLAATAAAADTVDLLIVAPHPDDEVIGCAGVIMRAKANGRKVAVVVMTNGDAFPKGTSAFTRKLTSELTPKDFLNLARLRQGQSLEAIEKVGLTRADLTFLSYPDGGLAAIHRSEDGKPYRNRHTGKNKTYPLLKKDYHSAKHGSPAPYTRAAILGDLEEIIRERSPAEIYVTNELDGHSDHRAAMWFVRDAAAAAGFKGTLNTFIVHESAKRGLPKTRPRRTPLTKDQVEIKRTAIGIHKIPKVHDHLAEKHAKPEELFWKIPVGR